MGKRAYVNQIASQLNQKFELENLGIVNHLLGVRFTSLENCTYLDQSHYVDKILNMANLLDCNTSEIPMNATLDIDTNSRAMEKSEEPGYREIIGSILFLAKCTRLDICFAVGLSQYLNNSNKSHFTAALKICKYLKGAKNFGIKYSPKDSKSYLRAYSDSSYGDCTNRKSTHELNI